MEFVRYQIGPLEIDGPDFPEGQGEVMVTLIGRVVHDLAGKRLSVRDWTGPVVSTDINPSPERIDRLCTAVLEVASALERDPDARACARRLRAALESR